MTRRLALVVACALVLGACTPDSADPTSTTGATVTTTPPDGTTSTTTAGTTTTLPEPTWEDLPGVEALPAPVQEELLSLGQRRLRDQNREAGGDAGGSDGSNDLDQG